MRIGIVCYPTYGGSGVVATELGKELAKKGHDVHMITYDVPVRFDHLNPNLHYHEVVLSKYPLFDYQPYELQLSSKIVDVAIHENLDLLHVHYAIPHASAAFMAREILKTKGRNVPFITTLHGTDITLVGSDSSFEPVITFAINQSDAVTAVSDSLKQDTCRMFDVGCNIDVIPNFIDLERYENNQNEELKRAYAPNGEAVLMHISNFRPVKRVEDVVKVFAKVREDRPTKLLLVGDGPERYKMEDMCRQLGACDDIHFLGKMKNTEEAHGLADVFILPSETESFGLAALEAMSSSVPVISSNGGGLPEVNEHGYSGFMNDVGDTDGMAVNAIKLLDDLPTYRKQALEQAKKFRKSAIIPLYEDLYDKVVAQSFAEHSS
ncbi:MAG: N-acetyl-alpha-D-glucosaminyl L-malate synthase BshA [Granulosicoccus sp.]|jgi:N-acetyl-alpha-D-glucosaminyl L-malate synthase BshA